MNNTYFSSTGSDTSPCGISVCRTNDQICQIRLDFDDFVIAGPVTTIAETRNTNCFDATFTASSQGKSSGSTICGTNSGQHMILEAQSGCNRLGTLSNSKRGRKKANKSLGARKEVKSNQHVQCLCSNIMSPTNMISQNDRSNN